MVSHNPLPLHSHQNDNRAPPRAPALAHGVHGDDEGNVVAHLTRTDARPHPIPAPPPQNLRQTTRPRTRTTPAVLNGDGVVVHVPVVRQLTHHHPIPPPHPRVCPNGHPPP